MFRFIITLNFMITFAIGATFNVSTTAEFRQALLDAARNGQDDTIILSDGAYGINDDGGGAFDIGLPSRNDNMDLEIIGQGLNTILSGENSDGILELGGLNDISFKNLSFIDTPQNNSGAIYLT